MVIRWLDDGSALITYNMYCVHPSDGYIWLSLSLSLSPSLPTPSLLSLFLPSLSHSS